MTVEDLKWSETIHAQLAREIKEGGELVDLPCPMCGLPRCQRSSYIRCSKCGVNWLPGEDLSRNPRIERFELMVEALRSGQKKKGQAE